MLEEKLRKIAQEEIKKQIMENLDSSIIFTYINNLEKQLEQEKEEREIAEENHKVLSLDLGDALKELGLPEDTIIADELVLEINNRYISKDKIRTKIEELKNTCYYNEGDATAVEQVFILEKLLEE